MHALKLPVIRGSVSAESQNNLDIALQHVAYAAEGRIVLKAGDIAKIKKIYRHVFEETWRNRVQRAWFDNQGDRRVPQDFRVIGWMQPTFASVATIVKNLRVLQRMSGHHPVLAAALVIAGEAELLADHLKNVTSSAPKRRVHQEEVVPEDDTDPLSCCAPGMVRIAEALNGHLASAASQHEETLAKSLVAGIDEYVRLSEGIISRRIRGEETEPVAPAEFFADKPIPGMLIDLFSKSSTDRDGNFIITMSRGWKEAVLSMASEHSAQARRSFALKTARRLDAATSGKKDLAAVEIIKLRAVPDRVEGEVRLRFADGAVLTSRSGVALSYTSQGKPSMRFTISFIDARLADGTRISKPTEDSIFAAFGGT